MRGIREPAILAASPCLLKGGSMGRGMMRRAIPLIVLALLAIGFLIARCDGDSGEAMKLPVADTVREVEITQGNMAAVIDDPDIMAALIHEMSAAEDTGRESVNDSPAVGGAVRIRLVVSDSESITVFAYFDQRGLQYKGTLYLEIPYQGIYSIDAAFWDSVEQLLRQT